MDFTAIETALTPRVAIRGTNEPLTYRELDADLLTSASGLFVNEVSEKWFAIDQVDQMLAWHEGKKYDVWAIGTNYGKLGGLRVFKTIDSVKQSFVSKVNATADNLAKDPETESDFWETGLSYDLRNYRQNAITSMIGDLGNFRNVEAHTDKLKGYNQAWRALTQNRQRTKQGRFIFFYIFPGRNPEHLLKLLKIGMKVDTAQTLPVYLYHSDNEAHLQQFDVIFASGDINKFVWKQLTDTNGDPAVIKSFNAEQSGGAYIIGFYEDDLTGNIFGWQNVGQIWSWRPITAKFFTARPGEFNNSRVTSKPLIPDIGEYFDAVEDDGNLYFNLWFSLYEDFTNVVVENADSGLYDRLLQLKWAILMLQDMAATNRKNLEGSERKEITQLLDGKSATFAAEAELEKTYTSGVRKLYSSELKRVMNDLANVTSDQRGLVQTF